MKSDSVKGALGRGIKAMITLSGMTMAGYGPWVMAGSGEVSSDLPYLDTVIVTGSRTEQPLADTPVRVHVLDHSTIQSVHPRDAKDALRVVPGLQLHPIHGKTGSEVYLQGMDGDRVLVLVDGLPVSPTTSSTVDVTQLSTLDIAQVEVLPGAASALYGSAAMGGVVNIVTRQADTDSGLTVTTDAGKYSGREIHSGLAPQRHYQVVATHRMGETRLQISADQRRSSDFDLNPTSYTSNHFDGHKTNLTGRLDSRWVNGLGSGTARLLIERYQERLASRIYTLSGDEGTKDERLSRWRVVAGGEQSLTNGDVSWTGMIERQTDRTAQTANGKPLYAGNLWRMPHFQQAKLATQWNWFGQLSDRFDLDLVTGIEVNGETIEQPKQEILLTEEGVPDTAKITSLDNGAFLVSSNEVPFERRRAIEAFVQSTLDVYSEEGKEFDVSLGTRWQHDSDFGAFVSPSLSLRQSLAVSERWSLQTRQSVGVGYRVPNLKNRYYLFDHSIHGYKVEGNPELTPEQSRSVQVSGVLSDSAVWHLELSAFNNRIMDLIEARDTGQKESNGQVSVYEYTNYAHALTRGYELSTRTRFTPNWHQRLSASYLDARNLADNVPLPSRAKHIIKGYWQWDMTDRVSWTLVSEYQGKLYSSLDKAIESGLVSDQETSPAYWRWDINADIELSPVFRWYAGINNLTDSVRDTRDSYDRRLTEGRYVFTGFEWDIY